MTLYQLIELFDDWNSIVKVNNYDLTASKLFKITDLEGKILNYDVMAWGFYDGQLCVRIDAIDL